MAKKSRSRTRVSPGLSGGAVKVGPPPLEDVPAVPRAAVLALAAALALAGAWAYSTSFRGVLVLDDIRAIARNETIRSFSSALSPAGESTVAARPVANLSFAINYALAPPDARNAFVAGPQAGPSEADAVRRNLWGYHLVNLLVHLAAALALFGVVHRTLAAAGRLKPCPTDPRPREVFTSSALRLPPSAWVAFVIALLWVVHPLHTESVTYVVQRVESLMGLFYVLTLYCAIRAWEGPRARWWTALAIVACALGMGTKEAMVGAPFVVLAWDWLFARRPLRPRLPLYVGLAATWLLLAVLVTSQYRGASVHLGEGMAWRYLATQAGVIRHYLRLSFVPAPLVFLYTWPLERSFAAVLPQTLLVGGLALLTAGGLVRRHPLAITGAWFFVVLAPSSSLLPIVTEVAAEHRMYLPLASVVACVVIGLFLGGRWLLRRVEPGGVALRAAFAAAVVAVLAVAGVFAEMTRERGRDYWSEESLWRDTVEKQPANVRARTAYGVTLFNRGKLAEAEEQLRAAIVLDPMDATAIGRLGGVLAARGQLDEAIARLQRAADLTGRRDPFVLMMLASAQGQARRFGAAAASAAEAERAARAQGRAEMATELARRAAGYAEMARRW